MGKEVLQGVDAEGRLHIFAVADTADGTDVVASQLRHILQLHGLEQRVITLQEEGLLQPNDGVHRANHTLAALCQGIYEKLPALYVLARKPYIFLHSLRQLCILQFGIGLQLLCGIRTYHQRRPVAAIQLHGDVAVLVVIHYEVGRYLMSQDDTLLAKGRARTGIQVLNLALEFLHLQGRQLQLLLDALPTLVYEVVEVSLHHLR